jgi:anti-sigma B factor antagonist
MGENTTALRITGEIDVFTSTTLKTAINTAIEGGSSRIVLFMENVEYLDSTGLGVLIGALKNLREKQGSLVLIAPTARVLRLFDLTGLVTVFTIYQTVEEANAHEGVALA